MVKKVLVNESYGEELEKNLFIYPRIQYVLGSPGLSQLELFSYIVNKPSES